MQSNSNEGRTEEKRIKKAIDQRLNGQETRWEIRKNKRMRTNQEAIQVVRDRKATQGKQKQKEELQLMSI